jgi:hypothetical protein
MSGRLPAVEVASSQLRVHRSGDAFDRDTANRRNADGAPRRRSVSVQAIVIYRQEVRPMDAVSAVGAPLQCTIARLR